MSIFKRKRQETIITPEVEPKKLSNDLLILSKISEIYGIALSDINYRDNGIYYEIEFIYKNMLIHAYTNIERGYGHYQDLEIKFISEEYDCDWTNIADLIAYNDNENDYKKIDDEYMIKSLIRLKGYIDSNRLSFCYYSKDYERRFFVLHGKVKELPIGIDLDKETELSYGDEAYLIENNKVIYEWDENPKPKRRKKWWQKW